MNYILPILLLLITLTTGCSSIYNYRPNLSNSYKTLDNRVVALNSLPCCVSPENMISEPLSTETFHLTMEENKSATEFNNFKSHYRLFDLSQLPDMSYFQLITYTQESENSPFLLFVPKVYFLDSEFKTLRESSYKHLYFERWSIRNNNNFKHKIKIDKQTMPNQRYMLIVSSPIPYGEYINFSRSYNSSYTNVIGGQVYTVNEPRTQSIRFKSAPSGVITIENLNSWSKPLNDAAYRF